MVVTGRSGSRRKELPGREFVFQKDRFPFVVQNFDDGAGAVERNRRNDGTAVFGIRIDCRQE